MAEAGAADSATDGVADVRDSARGWHQIQLAVLGFVGLCGVLQRGRPENPSWLQTLALLLIVGALVTALAAVFVVGRVAWPPGSAPARPERVLRTGIVLTFIAVGLLALGTTSMWWPESKGAASGQVEVRAADGQSWCGRLAAARPGAVAVQTGDRTILIGLGDVATLRSVDSCS
jgi:hypothetical protein